MNIYMTPYTFRLHQVVGLLEDTEKISYGCEIRMISKSTGLLCSSNSKESSWSTGDPGLIPGLGRSSGEGNGSPLQYSCLENLMDRGAWRATVHGITKSRTRLSDWAEIEHTWMTLGVTQNTHLWTIHTTFTRWCTTLKIFTIWPFIRKVCWSLSPNILSCKAILPCAQKQGKPTC